MDSTWTLFKARELGVELTVEGERIIASPSENITPGLRSAIKTNKRQLRKDLLMRDALAYLADRAMPGADLSALDSHADRIEEAYASDADPEEFREAIRGYVRAGLAAFAKVGKESAA